MTAEDTKKPDLPQEGSEEDDSIKEITEEKDKLEQENRRIKFIACLIVVCLLDFILFQAVENWAGAIVIGIFQILLIIFIGRILEIGLVDELITKILNGISK